MDTLNEQIQVLMENYTLNFEKPIPPEGTEMITSESNEIFIDLDSQEAVLQFVKVFSLADHLLDFKSLRIWKSRSKGVHAVIDTGIEMPLFERLALACAMGSDPVHTLLTVIDRVDVLFKPTK